MALPKAVIKNVKLDADVYAAMKAICLTEEGIDPCDWAAEVLTSVVKSRVRKANVITSQLEATGALRSLTE